MLQALPILFLASVVIFLFRVTFPPGPPKPKPTSAEKLGEALGKYLGDYDKKIEKIEKYSKSIDEKIKK